MITDKQKEDYKDKLSETSQAVYTETLRAKALFDWKPFNNQHEGYAVILEEIDELWDEIKKKQKDYNIGLMRKEATQAAAMLLRFIVELT